MIVPELLPTQKEAVMGKAVSTQHPAVVLRSQYQQLRALLAVAMIAVVGLATAVVVLAVNDESVIQGSAQELSAPSTAAATRSDGGPDESAIAAGLGVRAASVGPDESRIASAIGSDTNSPSTTGGPDESAVADAISGR
jgi:hypothetical protein